MPTGIPSMGESGRPACQRSVLAAAACRAPSISVAASACTAGSRASMTSRQRSSQARGVSLPSRKAGSASWKVSPRKVLGSYRMAEA